jgi:hypothetical protein
MRKLGTNYICDRNIRRPCHIEGYLNKLELLDDSTCSSCKQFGPQSLTIKTYSNCKITGGTDDGDAQQIMRGRSVRVD